METVTLDEYVAMPEEEKATAVIAEDTAAANHCPVCGWDTDWDVCPVDGTSLK